MDNGELATDGVSLSALSVEDRIQVLAVLITDTLTLRAKEEAAIVQEFED